MLRLGRLTDYAVIVLTRLAREPAGAVRTAPSLAGELGLPEPSVVKVLKQLAQHGFVQASRGATGGYALTRSAALITMREVVTALEGPIALAACVEGSDESCIMESNCPVKGRWDPVNEALNAALEDVTLADMIRREAAAFITQGVR